MGGWVVGVFSKGLAAVLGVAAVVWLGLWYFIPAPPSTLAMWSGLKGGAFEHIAQRYQERLARDHVTLDVRFSSNPADNIKFLEDRNSGISATFLFGGIT